MHLLYSAELRYSFSAVDLFLILILSHQKLRFGARGTVGKSKDLLSLHYLGSIAYLTLYNGYFIEYFQKILFCETSSLCLLATLIVVLAGFRCPSGIAAFAF